VNPHCTSEKLSRTNQPFSSQKRQGSWLFFAKPSILRRQIKNPSLSSIRAFYAAENRSSIICDKMSSLAYQRASKFREQQNSKICTFYLLGTYTIRWKN